MVYCVLDKVDFLDNLTDTFFVFGSLYSMANEDVIGEVPI